MAFVLLTDGADVFVRDELTERIERLGHEMRADADPVYKRATWGLRPEDVEAQQALMGAVTGQGRK